MVVYTSAKHYIDSCEGLDAKIAAIDAIILSLFSTAAQAATNDDIEEYWLNDGQTQIKCIYKGIDHIKKSIFAFEQLKQMYAQRKGGRMTRLVDSKNFPSNGNFF
jgi:hypothetical protein